MLSWAQFNTQYAKTHPGATLISFISAWKDYQAANPKPARKPRKKKDPDTTKTKSKKK